MAVRKIIRMGHPTLRRVARPLEPDEIGSDIVHRLVTDMIETLHDYGGIGLAAPQINESIRLAIVELPGGPSRYGELPDLPLTVFVNPQIEVIDASSAGYWEGCLSVPGLRGFVERPRHILVKALNLHGEALELPLNGFPATVFQHEFDHLDGRLYLDHIKDTENLVFEEEYQRYVLPFEVDPDSDSASDSDSETP
ncbi:MAG: peptide deformylase [Pseudomonadales bacterium]